MKTSAFVRSFVIIVSILCVTGCVGSLSFEKEDGTHDGLFNDGVVMATLDIAGDGKSVKLVVQNLSGGVVQLEMGKASFKGSPLVKFSDLHNENAQPMPPVLIAPSGQAINILVLKGSAYFISKLGWKDRAWAKEARVSDFVFAYTVGGVEKFITFPGI